MRLARYLLGSNSHAKHEPFLLIVVSRYYQRTYVNRAAPQSS